VRFSDVNTFSDADALGRHRYANSASNESLEMTHDDDSDLNTTTSGSFSVPPDDLYDSLRQSTDTGYTSRSKYDPHDLVV
jgi:hypothetical protein